jgi:hypothetical protein
MGNGSAILFRRWAQISSAAFAKRPATEEGVDPMQNRSERGFAQAPHPSSRSLKEERTTTSDQHGEKRALNRIQAHDDPECIAVRGT